MTDAALQVEELGLDELVRAHPEEAYEDSIRDRLTSRGMFTGLSAQADE